MIGTTSYGAALTEHTQPGPQAAEVICGLDRGHDWSAGEPPQASRHTGGQYWPGWWRR